MVKSFSWRKKTCFVLCDICAKLDTYKRGWNLRVADIKEQTGETTDYQSLQQDLSRYRRSAPQLCEYCAQTGSLIWQGEIFWCIIVKFTSRTHQDKVWRVVKASVVLKQRKIKIMEDLCQGAKDALNKFWPLKQASKDRKKAGFQEPFASISGKRVTVNDV